MGKYFSRFPAINYNGQISKNLLVRARINETNARSNRTYYDYTLPEEKRADVISNDYYENPDYTWLIYLANNIVDPYHDYYLSENDFNLFIIKKYGSLQFAQTTVHSWVLSWGMDQRELTPVQYEALPGYLKRYWKAVVLTAYSDPSKYVRARDNTVIQTNRQAIISVDSVEGLQVGQEYQGLDANGNKYISIIETIVGNTLTLKHIVGHVSGDLYVPLNGSLLDVANIKAEEVIYWMPLSIYDYEAANNAVRRNISLVDKQLAFQVEKDLKKVLNQ